MESILTLDGIDVDKIGGFDLLYEVKKLQNNQNSKPYFTIESVFASTIQNKEDFKTLFYFRPNAEAELFKVEKLTRDNDRPKQKIGEMEDSTIGDIDTARNYLSETFEHLVQPEFVVWAMNYVREFPELNNAECMNLAFNDWVKTCVSVSADEIDAIAPQIKKGIIKEYVDDQDAYGYDVVTPGLDDNGYGFPVGDDIKVPKKQEFIKGVEFHDKPKLCNHCAKYQSECPHCSDND